MARLNHLYTKSTNHQQKGKSKVRSNIITHISIGYSSLHPVSAEAWEQQDFNR